MEDSGLDSVDKGSPGLKPFYPKIEPSPSPPPPEHMPSTTASHGDHGPGKACGTSGDAVLVEHLGNWENPEIALSATEEDLPPDQGDKEEDPTKNVTLPGSQAPERTTLKSLRDTAFRASAQGNSQILPPARGRVAYQPGNDTGGGHPNEELLTNFCNGLPLVIYEDDPSSGEVS